MAQAPGGSARTGGAGDGATAAAASLLAAGEKRGQAGTAAGASTAVSDAAAGVSQLGSATPAGGAAGVVPTATVQVHASVDSTDFSQGLSDRVSWMVDNGINNAKLQVNPPQLGPIELSISVQGDHAQVMMTTHSAVTRDALEASSPKLREMLNSQGFGQVSVDISQRSFQDRSAYTPPSYQQGSSTPRTAAAAPAVTASTASVPRSSLGGLDAYA